MCATCGCGMPKNKHGQKTLDKANKKFDKKKPCTCGTCKSCKAKKKK